jgi:hypothetical protein
LGQPPPLVVLFSTAAAAAAVGYSGVCVLVITIIVFAIIIKAQDEVSEGWTVRSWLRLYGLAVGFEPNTALRSDARMQRSGC